MSDHHLPFFSSHLWGSSAVESVRFRCGAFCEFSSVYPRFFGLRWLIQFAPFWRLPIKPFCLDKERHALELVTRLCPLHHESPFTHFSHFLHAPFSFLCRFAICISLNSLLILLDFFSHFPSLYFCNIFISYDFHFQFFTRFHFALCKYLSTLLLMLFMRTLNAVVIVIFVVAYFNWWWEKKHHLWLFVATCKWTLLVSAKQTWRSSMPKSI